MKVTRVPMNVTLVPNIGARVLTVSFIRIPQTGLNPRQPRDPKLSATSGHG